MTTKRFIYILIVFAGLGCLSIGLNLWFLNILHGLGVSAVFLMDWGYVPWAILLAFFWCTVEFLEEENK